MWNMDDLGYMHMCLLAHRLYVSVELLGVMSLYVRNHSALGTYFVAPDMKMVEKYSYLFFTVGDKH